MNYDTNWLTIGMAIGGALAIMVFLIRKAFYEPFQALEHRVDKIEQKTGA